MKDHLKLLSATLPHDYYQNQLIFWPSSLIQQKKMLVLLVVDINQKLTIPSWF